ncbi:phytanoyl-CoA dioxygenase [Cohnella sp. CIP 111063]|jgi:Protein involved in biosynthesis of mitomycin antibiotics/polyketide fumonisin|uniref:phytanoyl-CoA dioxygenase family protein n=1 Tax=unclassified Cohnella TaxID=2636738 RepID=UPI000B8BDD51|nr:MULTISPECIES: phytanoyl-CoA dioxygenase family protein [unclassified Cohnella]OXS58974.1 phytanoyl-CoA dioxygenase [Cohnella sp. CIP 111063]PRX71834.1 phytanoyl-CoA dioxygenase PhyH [Cohnella sp. SGD-V74]
MTQLLTKTEVDAYQEQGYTLYKKPVFSKEKMDRLRGIFEDHLAEKGDKLSDELDTPHFRDKRLLEFLLADEVLDLVEPIIGPNIMLWSSHFICKDPYVGRATPWHEDSAYWNGRFDKYDKIVTVWLAIDRSFKDNGCMRVIPGTHHNGFSQYENVDMSVNTFHAQIKDIDESKAVYFELEPGECSLHDSRIIHGAAANTSPYRRCGYTMRFISTDTKVIPEKNENWEIILARGVDLAGNSYVKI